ncbi:ABC transporter substrate-binding protein [Modestobacter lapidis]|nr:ABC transporter substrate-binding protein [Modestobacter lapidis]
MSLRTRRRAAVAAVAALPLLTLGCGSDAEPEASGGGGDGAQEVATVTLGLIPIIDVAPIHLGMEQGFFADQGIELELSAGQGGAAIVPGIVSGSLDVGFTNNLSLVIASAAGLPLQVVASGVDSAGDPETDQFTIVTADDSITRPADLSGKTVAVNTVNAIGDTVVKASVEADGGDPDSINFVELAFPTMPAAVTAGDVDAAWLVEPFVTIGESQGIRVLTTPLNDFTDIEVEVSTYVTSQQFATENPEVLDRFRTALEESLEYAQQNPEAVRAILPTYLDMPPELAAQVRLPVWNTDVSEETLELFTELGQKYGVLTGEPDLDALLAGVE